MANVNKFAVELVLTEDAIRKVEALAFEIWQEHYISIIGLQQVEYMLANFQSALAITQQIQEGYLYYLISNEFDYIGYLAVLPKKSDKELFLSKIYIKLNDRGKGYGKQTLYFVKNLAKQNSCKKITLTVNKNNINSILAYEKIGFKKIGSVVKDIGQGFVMDDFLMEKEVL